jgi:hypothetical protein
MTRTASAEEKVVVRRATSKRCSAFTRVGVCLPCFGRKVRFTRQFDPIQEIRR